MTAALATVKADPEGGRVLAIDFGERRIGLAVSDPTRTIASPAGFVVRRAGKRPPVAELVRQATAHEATAIAETTTAVLMR